VTDGAVLLEDKRQKTKDPGQKIKDKSEGRRFPSPGGVRGGLN